jgi:hypothetical protein
MALNHSKNPTPSCFALENRLIHLNQGGGENASEAPPQTSEAEVASFETTEDQCVAMAEETKEKGGEAVSASVDNDDQMLEARSDEYISEAMSQLSPEDIAAVKDALLPETNINEFVKLCTGQNKLDGYQKILLAPANAFEGIARGIVGLPDTISSMSKAIGEADTKSLDAAGKLVWEIFTNHMTLAEQTAIAVGIGAEALTGAGIANLVNKIAKSAKVMEVMAKVGKVLAKVSRFIPKIAKTERAVAGTGSLAKVTQKIGTVGKEIVNSKAVKVVKKVVGSEPAKIANKARKVESKAKQNAENALTVAQKKKGKGNGVG